ncbi:MAG: sulfite exporter TauE/SafE family protein [Solirubrobacteraceae bacterium]
MSSPYPAPRAGRADLVPPAGSILLKERRCGHTSGVTVALVALVALIASCVQAAASVGFALIVTPVLFAVMSPAGAIITGAALGLMLNLLMLFAEPRRPTVAWGEAMPIFAAAIPGSICGVLILQNVPKPALQIAIGIAVITVTAQRLMRRPPAPAAGTVRAPSLWSRLSLGLATGTLSTSTGVSGPPLALWLSTRGLSPAELRDSMSALFFGTGVIAAVTVVPLLHSAHVDTWAVAAAAAGVLAGHAIGSRLFTRLTGQRVQYAMLAVIVASGTASLVLGLTAAL